MGVCTVGPASTEKVESTDSPKSKKKSPEANSEQPVKISMAVMFVDEGVVKTAEAEHSYSIVAE